jgi:hypothetical protein
MKKRIAAKPENLTVVDKLTNAHFIDSSLDWLVQRTPDRCALNDPANFLERRGSPSFVSSRYAGMLEGWGF